MQPGLMGRGAGVRGVFQVPPGPGTVSRAGITSLQVLPVAPGLGGSPGLSLARLTALPGGRLREQITSPAAQPSGASSSAVTPVPGGPRRRAPGGPTQSFLPRPRNAALSGVCAVATPLAGSPKLARSHFPPWSRTLGPAPARCVRTPHRPGPSSALGPLSACSSVPDYTASPPAGDSARSIAAASRAAGSGGIPGAGSKDCSPPPHAHSAAAAGESGDEGPGSGAVEALGRGAGRPTRQREDGGGAVGCFGVSRHRGREAQMSHNSHCRCSSCSAAATRPSPLQLA